MAAVIMVAVIDIITCFGITVVFVTIREAASGIMAVYGEAIRRTVGITAAAIPLTVCILAADVWVIGSIAMDSEGAEDLVVGGIMIVTDVRQRIKLQFVYVSVDDALPLPEKACRRMVRREF